MILSLLSVREGTFLLSAWFQELVTLWSRRPYGIYWAFSIVTNKSLSSEVTEVRKLSYYGIIIQIVLFRAIMS